jgi:hypothetical protein
LQALLDAAGVNRNLEGSGTEERRA